MQLRTSKVKPLPISEISVFEFFEWLQVVNSNTKVHKIIDPYWIDFRHNVKSSSLPVQIFFKYLDLLQDVLLVYYAAVSMGGISVVFENPTLFSSVVSLYSIVLCMHSTKLVLGRTWKYWTSNFPNLQKTEPQNSWT